MKFNWNGFTEEDFVDYCAKMENNMIADSDYVGCVRAGDLAFDLVVREYYGKYVLDFDLYVGGIDDGYSYGENNYPYTEAAGNSFKNTMISLTYDEFASEAENLFTDYIFNSEYSEKYNLVKKANEPLHVW